MAKGVGENIQVPELKPFVFQGAGSFVVVPACVKAIASRKPSLMVLWLFHSNVDKAESETPLYDIIQNKCDICFCEVLSIWRVTSKPFRFRSSLSEIHVVQGKYAM